MSNVTNISDKRKVELSPREARLMRALKVASSQLALHDSALKSRADLASSAGKTFKGNRDVYEALGYKLNLDHDDFFDRYQRDGIARRVVRAYPDATWRGLGGDLVENEDPNVVTTFESGWFEMSERLRCWSVFRRADVLAGLGRFAVILIGAPGNLETPIGDSLKPEEIYFLSPYAERDVKILEFEQNAQNERWGLPTIYQLNLDSPSFASSQTRETRNTAWSAVHHSRIIHVAEGLEDTLYGTPRLEPVWNRFDDLDKVTGGGSEAFWQRAHPGTQFDLDPAVEFAPGEEDKFDEEIEEWMNGFKRHFQTRGVKATQFKADVANFDKNADAILSQIAAGAEIPQRILLGSERGQLASEQDRENWAERVQDRRAEWAGPIVVRPFAQLMIAHKALPKPVTFDVRWPTVHDLSDDQRVSLAIKMAQTTMAQGEIVFLTNEIRDRTFGMGPLTPEERLAHQAQNAVDPLNPAGSPKKPTNPNDQRNPIAAIRRARELKELRQLLVVAQKKELWRGSGRKPVAQSA